MLHNRSVHLYMRDEDCNGKCLHFLRVAARLGAFCQDTANWEFMYHEMRRYKEEYGNLEVPFKWKDPMADFNNHFSRWFHAQPTLFLQRRLRTDQVWSVRFAIPIVS